MGGVMKKVIFVLALVFCAVPLVAYERTEMLIGDKIQSGGFGAPMARYTQVDGKWGLMFGGRGGWIINNAFVLGGGGYKLVDNNLKSDIVDSSGGRQSFELNYGGIEMEYIAQHDDLVHIGIGALLGGGNAGLSGGESASFFVIEPGMNVELNVSRHFRINLGAAYRLVSGVDTQNLSNEKINGPGISLAFKS